MALPEYKAQAPAAAAVTLQQLQHLTEKLKKDGDNEGAALLQRFVHEQGHLAEHSESIAATTGHDCVEIQFEAFEISSAELATGSNPQAKHGPVGGFTSSVVLDTADPEVLQLGKIKKSRLINKVKVLTGFHEHVSAANLETFPVPAKGATGLTITQDREFGTIVDVVAVPDGNDRIRLQIVVDHSIKDDKTTN